jgi:cytochrome c-type biogenesis protein
VIAYLLFIAASLFLGVLTSISPCPLATNIAAISYVGRKVANSRWVLAAGLLYTLGRCLLYLSLAVMIAATAMSIPAVAIFLQHYIELFLGPIFLVIGAFLLELITFDTGGAALSERLQKKIDTLGVWGALALGVLFAVAFCPTSAALFFGLLAIIFGAECGAATSILERAAIVLPSAVPPGAVFVLPLIYGIGTALPVLLMAFLLAYSVKSIGKAYKVLSQVEWWARRITGWIFVIAGFYFSLAFVFQSY